MANYKKSKIILTKQKIKYLSKCSKSLSFSSTANMGVITMAYGPQGTGSWKGNRDKHEKSPHNSTKKEKECVDISNKK